MKTVAANRRARFDYAILETIEAGMMLTGSEVKSCRLGTVNLAGSYVGFMGGRAVLKNATISRYKYSGGDIEYDPTRDRPLLLKKTDMERLAEMTGQKGVTVIPLEMKAGRFIKLVLGLAQGRKKGDKRQVIRERETKRRLREGREE